MLNSVEVYNELGTILELSLEDDTSEYVVKNIVGLGPVKADIATTSYVSMDGGVFQSARGNMRNIVLSLGFDPSYEASADPYGELRRGLYSWFRPKAKVYLHLVSDNMETVKICGYVESFEPSLFTKDPEVQISIVCPDPYFYSLYSRVHTRQGTGIITFENPGSENSGFTFVLEGYSILESPAFTVRRTELTDSMSYLGSMYVQGEPVTLYIETVKGSKAARWMYQDDYEPSKGADQGANVLGFIDNWLEVIPGQNTFEFLLPSSAVGTKQISMSYTPRYVGL